MEVSLHSGTFFAEKTAESAEIAGWLRFHRCRIFFGKTDERVFLWGEKLRKAQVLRAAF